MFDFAGNRGSTSMRHLLLTVIVAMLQVFTTACNKKESAAVEAGPETFASPEDAGKALAIATKSQNLDQIVRIFGPEAKEILASGDLTENKASLSEFAKSYQVMNRWRRLADGGQLLIVGADNNVFPIPLMKNAAGRWYFDTKSGKEEILSRRIGRNELDAISICDAIVDAQAQYFAQKHAGTKQYAQKFISDPGQQNGLYWPEVQGQPRSPLGPMVAYATSEGYKAEPNHHQPYHGYYYIMLPRQGPGAKGGAKDYIVNGKMRGGFAVLAYPANYGDSGIMTFLINQNGVLLQKDFGKTTDQVASAITEFNPDNSWTIVE
jgi:Protein of unknown function (DUF2950)